MRLAAILFAGAFALLAHAETTTSVTPTTTDPATAAQNSAQASMLACINACKAGDVSCTSKCIAVPNPSASQVNATNTCVGECPKGSGSASDTAAYSSCVQKCINTNYFTASAGTPQPTANSGSSSGNGGNDNGNGSNNGGSSSGTSGNQASGTGSSPASTSSHAGAAQLMQMPSGVVGAVGFLAAVLAL